MGVLEEEMKGKLGSGCSILGKSLFSVIIIIKILNRVHSFKYPLVILEYGTCPQWISGDTI